MRLKKNKRAGFLRIIWPQLCVYMHRWWLPPAIVGPPLSVSARGCSMSWDGQIWGVWKDSYKTMYIFWRLDCHIFFIPHHTSLPKYQTYNSIISYTSYFDSQPHTLFDFKKKAKKQLKVAVFADDWVQTQVQPTSAIAQRIVENTSPLSTQSNLYVSQSIRGKEHHKVS